MPDDTSHPGPDDDRPAVLFHCAPAAARASIATCGIDPERSPWPRWEQVDGFYAFTEFDEARWYAAVMARMDPPGPFDIWQVTSSQTCLPDDGLSSDPDADTSACFHPGRVGPEAVALVATCSP